MVVYADIPMMLIASLYLVDQKIIPFFEVFNSLDRCSVCQIVCFLI